MEKICKEFNLLSADPEGVVRVPFLIKGKIVSPPNVNKSAIEAAFEAEAKKECTSGGAVTHARLEKAQLLREPLIDRRSMKYTGEYLYQVMPSFSPEEIIESDLDKLTTGLYALSVNDILQYLTSLREVLEKNLGLVNAVRELSRRTSEFPDAYLDAAFSSLSVLLDPEMARAMIDNELSAWDKAGSAFLEGWVEVPASVFPGLTPMFAQNISPNTEGGALNKSKEQPKTSIRAMPTRQLHITAGNAPAVPIVSALRAIVTKSAGVIKSPYGATLPGALLALASCAAAPEHPITRNLSIIYWPGGDEGVETSFFIPGSFDRIVVWGAPDAVSSVRSRALFTKVICFNPRYGISLIGREAFDGDLKEVARRASMDVMIWNQKACIASLVHYVEGTDEQVALYAKTLSDTLAEWDTLLPQFVSPGIRGQMKRLQRGKFLNVPWMINKKGSDFSSAVVVMPGEFNILDHPMCRLVVVRKISDMKEVLKYLHHGVSTVGVYPENRRMEIRDYISARGVSNVLPLGSCERMFGGMPHDGMMALSELVDWKNG